MKEGETLWTREQTILAFNLYCKLPYGRLSGSTPEIRELAALIGKTPGAVGRKCQNFARLDPTLKARGIKGLSNGAKLEQVIWDEFYGNWENRIYESERLLADIAHTTVERLNEIPESELPTEGIERERVVRTRVNQRIFRKMVLASYNNTCCITGLQRPELLVASHIRRWADDPQNRMNPSNGLALNALHDRAFETGLIGIGPGYKVHVAAILKRSNDEGVKKLILPYDGAILNPPKRFLPDEEFLKEHFERRFLG